MPSRKDPRAAFKREQEDRRADIKKRWNRRRALQLMEDEIERVEAKGEYFNQRGATGLILDYGEWVEPMLTASRLMLHFEKSAPAGFAADWIAHLVRLIQLKEMPYDEFLQTDEWRDTAARAKKRFGGRCALDAKHPADHAHHRTYDRRGRELDTDVVPLCKICHAKFHDRQAA